MLEGKLAKSKRPLRVEVEGMSSEGQGGGPSG